MSPAQATPLILPAPGPDGGGPAAAATTAIAAIAARSPLREDMDAHQVARILGFRVVCSRRKVEVYDEKAVIAAGLTLSKPRLDYTRIARCLELGQTVVGARLTGFEYVLRPSEDAEFQGE